MRIARNSLGLGKGVSWTAAAVLVAMLYSGACGPPAPVLQGKVVALTEDGTHVQVADERNPEAPPVDFDISRAEIGNRPEVGDVLRVVYRNEAGTNKALRVMNVTKQAAVEKGGH
jgi:hypothetical protein